MSKKWLKRNVDGRPTEDQHIIQNIEYNSIAGAQKNVAVGPALEYIGALDTVQKVAKGQQLYILNTSGAIAYVEMGDSSLAGPAGTTPAPDVFPCFPGAYTLYSVGNYEALVGTADLHLYVLLDESRVRSNPKDR